MKTFPFNRKPLSAAQYLDKCQARANRQACALLDFRDACIRLVFYSVALVALCVTAANLIVSLLKF